MGTITEVRTASYHVVMASFQGTDTAQQAWRHLRADGALAGCEIEAEATLWRAEDGRLHVRERGAAGVGAAFGASTALLLGLIGGPIVLPMMMAAGGIAGGVLGHYAGRALPIEDLRRAGEALPAGASAFVAVVDSAHAASVAAAFAAEGGEVLDVAVETEISSMIREAITGGVRRVD
jgi:uncharacterized membrane protein